MSLQEDLSLKYNEELNLLEATFIPGDNPNSTSIHVIKKYIQSNDEKNLIPIDNEINSLVDSINNNIEGFFVIAKKAKISIKFWLSYNAMRAYVDFDPTCKGLSISPEELQEIITKEMIEVPLIDTVVTKLYAGEEIKNTLIAEGQYPVTTITEFVRKCNKKSNQPTKILPHMPIMVRYQTELQTANQPGHDVFNNKLPKNSNKTINFPQNTAGVSLNKNNYNMLISTVTGHPAIGNDYIHVEAIKIYKNINSNKKIKHNGSILIIGDLPIGIVIEASGDVIIDGTAQEVIIHAGGDVILSKGTEQTTLTAANYTKIEYKNKINSQGQIVAQYLNQTIANAYSDIKVNNYCQQCELTSNESIDIGFEGGQGLVRGGIIRARKNIKIHELGSEDLTETIVEIGYHDYWQEQKEKTHQQIIAKDIKLETIRNKLKKTIKETRNLSTNNIESIRTPIVQDIENTILSITEAETNFNLCLAKIEQSLLSSLLIENVMHPGAKVIYKDCEYICSTEQKEVIFTIKNHKIHKTSAREDNL